MSNLAESSLDPPLRVSIRVRRSRSPWRRWPLVVTFEGPDGAGKSTLADELSRWLERNDVTVRRARMRPRTSERLRSTSYDHQDPHATPRRGVLEAVARILVKYGFYLQRWAIEARPTRSPSVLIRERGWYDYDVDRTRYGLPPVTRPLVRGLGALFPRSDWAVVLVGDRHAIHARKPDLSVTEIDRIMAEWADLAPRSAHRTLVLDTTTHSPAEALCELLGWLVEPVAAPLDTDR